MTPHRLHAARGKQAERWLRQLVNAIRLNARNLDLWAASLAPADDPADIAQRVARRMRDPADVLHLPYRFEGERHRVYDLAAAQRRGFGACADATAALAAVVLMSRADCSVCYETAAPHLGYAHVRVAIGHTFVDAFPDVSLDVAACAATFDVTKESIGWPATAEEDAHRSLDAAPPQAGPPSFPEGSTT